MPGQTRQQTLDDIRASVQQVQAVRTLTHTQLNIIKLLDAGLYQRYIAQRLKLSPSYISQTVKMLTSLGLIVEKRARDPIQNRARQYDLTSKLRELLRENNLDTDSSYTLCTPHHIKLRYPILHMQGDIRKDGWKFSRMRSIYMKSWKPKGPERHLFHITVRDDTIGVEFHGKSIMAYRTNHDHIISDSVEEATRLIMMRVQEGVDRFIREQASLGTRIEIGTPKITDKPHYAFESTVAKAIIKKGGAISVEGLYADNSPESQGRPNVGDIETRDPVVASMVDTGLRKAMNIESIVQNEVCSAISAAIPEVISHIDSRLGPIQEGMEEVVVRLDQSAALTSQFNQLMTLLSNTVKELETIKGKIKGESEETTHQPVQQNGNGDNYEGMFQ